MIWRVAHVDAGRRSKRAKLWRRARSLMATGLRGKKRFSLLVLLLLICLLMMNWLHALSTASTCSVTRSQLYPVLLSMLGDPASVRIFVQTLEKNGGCPDFKVVKSAALWDEKYRNNLLASKSCGCKCQAAEEIKSESVLHSDSSRVPLLRLS